ncbi:MAG: serine hydrolase [Defluviitaleaceae bacterium]|nr:serine hydrolase [Defluviitaleaceae bacterium]
MKLKSICAKGMRMKRCFCKAIAVLLMLAMVGVWPAVAGAEESLIPLREAIEVIGGTIEWNDSDRSITMVLGEATVIFFADSNRALVNGIEITLPHPVIIENDRAFSHYENIDHAFLHAAGLGDAFLGETILAATISVPAVMEQLSIPGMVVAIVDVNENFAWVQGFGYADTTRNHLVDENTVFRLGSISKPFTAIAIMQLVEEGILDLNTPIIEYLPDFSINPSGILGGDYRNITAQMLLTHTSGITSNFLGYRHVTLDGYDAEFLNNFLENLSRYFMFQPEDTVFSYNNNGYVLLGAMVAHLTGDDNFTDDFIAYTTENIFAPAGMESTAFKLDSALLSRFAMPYIDANTPDAIIYYNPLPTGAILSSASDMVRFMNIVLADDGALLAPGTFRRMKQAHDTDFTIAGFEYGLGFMRMTTEDGFQATGHNGSLIHHNADVFFDMDSGLGVFVAANSITGMGVPNSVALSLLQSAVMEKTGTINALPARAQADATPIELTDELLALAGFYTGQLTAFIEVGESGGMYMSSPALPQLETFPITPMSDGSFDSLLGRLWFDRVEEDGEYVYALMLGNIGNNFLGIRVDREYFIATEAFMPWVGTFIAQFDENEIGIVTAYTYFVDENGMAFLQTSQLTGPGLATPVPVGEPAGAWLYGVENIIYDTDGLVQSFRILGLTLVRQ